MTHVVGAEQPEKAPSLPGRPGLRILGFRQQVGQTLVARGLVMAAGLGMSVAIARLIGPEGRGAYAVAATLTAVGVQFGHLGLHAANTHFAAKQRALLPALVGNSLVAAFGVASAATLAAWGVFTMWPGLTPIQGPLLALAAAAVPLGLAYLLLSSLLLGVQDVPAYNQIEVGTKYLALAGLGAVVMAGVTSPAWLYGVSVLVLPVGIAWTLWRLRPLWGDRPTVAASLFKAHLAFGFKAYMAALFAFLVLRLDVLMINHMLGAEAAGHYTIATTFADLIYTLPAVIGSLLFPRLSAMAEPGRRWHETRRATVAVSLAMVVVAVALGVLARPLIVLIFGEAFLPAVPALLALLPGIVMLAANTILMNYFAAEGMPLVTVVSPAIALLLNGVLNLQLLPPFGILGASLASTAAYGAMLAMSLWYLHRHRPLETEQS